GRGHLTVRASWRYQSKASPCRSLHAMAQASDRRLPISLRPAKRHRNSLVPLSFRARLRTCDELAGSGNRRDNEDRNYNFLSRFPPCAIQPSYLLLTCLSLVGAHYTRAWGRV